MSLHILFCSDFPLGYHNQEAELKLSHFVRRGYSATYVEKLGIRNPRPRTALQSLRRLRGAKVQPTSGSPAAPVFDTCSPRLLPPRRMPVIDGFNRRWLWRQLQAHMPVGNATIPWLRYPTPELVPLVCAMPSPLVIYEVVDDHEGSPGMSDHLRSIFREAEDRLLAHAGLVFAWSEPIAERLRKRHANVVLAPAAADVESFTAARRSSRRQERTVTYAGSLDFRFDARLVAETAHALPDWSFRLAGPADAEARAVLSAVPNVQLLGLLAPESVPAFLASGTACLMPYRQTAFNDNLFPIKLIESLASGRPTVSTDIEAVRSFSDVVAIASDVSGMTKALRDSAHDSQDAMSRRTAEAARYGWDHRIDEMQGALEAALT